MMAVVRNVFAVGGAGGPDGVKQKVSDEGFNAKGILGDRNEMVVDSNAAVGSRDISSGIFGAVSDLGGITFNEVEEENEDEGKLLDSDVIAVDDVSPDLKVPTISNVIRAFVDNQLPHREFRFLTEEFRTTHWDDVPYYAIPAQEVWGEDMEQLLRWSRQMLPYGVLDVDDIRDPTRKVMLERMTATFVRAFIITDAEEVASAVDTPGLAIFDARMALGKPDHITLPCWSTIEEMLMNPRNHRKLIMYDFMAGAVPLTQVLRFTRRIVARRWVPDEHARSVQGLASLIEAWVDVLPEMGSEESVAATHHDMDNVSLLTGMCETVTVSRLSIYLEAQTFVPRLSGITLTLSPDVGNYLFDNAKTFPNHILSEVLEMTMARDLYRHTEVSIKAKIAKTEDDSEIVMSFFEKVDV